MLRILVLFIAALITWGLLTLILTLLSNGPSYFRLRRLARERNEQEAFSAFAAALEHFPRSDIAAVYTQLQELVMLPRFPLLPGDYFLKHLAVDEGYLWECVDSMEENEGLVFPALKTPVIAGEFAEIILKCRQEARDKSDRGIKTLP